LSNGEQEVSYQPDRIDSEGLFEKGAAIEVKGYMYPEDWKKICLFREQYPNRKLLVISSDPAYADISYSALKSKYLSLIPLWETDTQNIRTRPDLYQVGYIPTEVQKSLEANYPHGINKVITNDHERSIASKCLSYCKVVLGIKMLVDAIKLQAITDRKPGTTRRSSGEFNFELWGIDTVSLGGEERRHFWVTNTEKSTTFYCHPEGWITHFFDENVDMSLRPGRKHEKDHGLVTPQLWEESDDNERRILQLANDKLRHRGELGHITAIEVVSQEPAKKGAYGNYERWDITVDHKYGYVIDNFGRPTQEYVLTPLVVQDDGTL